MINLQRYYTQFLTLFHDIEPRDNFLGQIRKPKLSEKELIALSLASEASGIDSELNLFNQLPADVVGKIERSVYNKRRRRLVEITQQLQVRIADRVIPCEDYHLIDSMPLEVCKMSRSRRSTVCCDEPAISPDYGFCAAQQMHYYGFKIHAVCTMQGVFKAFDISQASLHDIHYLEAVREHFSNCVVIGDKDYLSRQWQADLFEQSHVTLVTPLRKNQAQQPYPRVYRKARKRIETLFSQLCDQFMIRRNYAKSFQGFSTRIIAKITALTLIQLRNKRLNRNINNLKGFA